MQFEIDEPAGQGPAVAAFMRKALKAYHEAEDGQTPITPEAEQVVEALADQLDS